MSSARSAVFARQRRWHLGLREQPVKGLADKNERTTDIGKHVEESQKQYAE